MSITSIDYAFDFGQRSQGLSGTIAVLNPRTYDPQQAVLIFARYVDSDSGKALEITEENGIWSLTVPTEKGEVRFIPQSNCVTITEHACEEMRRIAFDNKNAIADLYESLRKDTLFFPSQVRFLEAAFTSLADIEGACYLTFELLDEMVGPLEIGDGERRRRRRKKKRLFPPRNFQIDWELGGFIDCMKECEKDCSWWEIWCHAWCLGKCLVKCARPSIPT